MPAPSMLTTCLLTLLACLLLSGCAGLPTPHPANTFGSDLQFLKEHTDVIVLQEESSHAQLALVPSMQGRIMTSTADGPNGLSFGWINRELIASGELKPHINVFGGEDRFWLGPEGGQFSIFFKKDSPFDLEHWFTPAPIDTEPFSVTQQSRDAVTLQHAFQLQNFSDTTFHVEVNRQVRMVSPSDAWSNLNITPPPDTKIVAFESVNTIKNAGLNPWKKETGLLSIWILGMFNPSPGTTIIIPIKPGPENNLGPKVNDDYFGKVPPDRLTVTDQALFFSGDGQYRSKIGVTPKRALPIMGSYDATNQVLTLVQFTLPPNRFDYVNSMWELQDQPYSGDAVNSYNDGPPEPGAKPLGPFYELESSSPAADLAPGQSLTHTHRTVHIQADPLTLDAIARTTLGVSLSNLPGQSSVPFTTR